MKGFDPLMAKNWNDVRVREILAHKVHAQQHNYFFVMTKHRVQGRAILGKYNGSLSEALRSAFPELNLDGTFFFADM